MGYQKYALDNEGIRTRRIKRAITVEDRKAQQAMQNFELAQRAEARAKAKRKKKWGLGAIIAFTAIAAAKAFATSGTSLWADIGKAVSQTSITGASAAYAAGGALGSVAYEEEWLKADENVDAMENALLEIEREKEGAMFADARTSLERYEEEALEIEAEMSDISIEALAPEFTTDFVETAVAMKMGNITNKTLGDIFSKATG